MSMRCHQRSLRLCVRVFGWFVAEDHVSGSISRWRLCSRMQTFQKRDQGSRFRWAQIFSIRRHIAASLDHLADELVLGQTYGDAVEGRATLSAALANGMAVAALFGLKHERALPLKRGAA